MKKPNTKIAFRLAKPEQQISDFVESFWTLENPSGEDREIVVLPDGRMDLIFSESSEEPFHVTLSGLETMPNRAIFKAGTRMCAISFKLLSTEYILQDTIADLLNYAVHLPVGFWDFASADLIDFDHFAQKAATAVKSLIPAEIDSRKRKLFNLVYASKGEMTVAELSEKTAWSSRQINRYFTQQFGLSLKTYCNILRFRSSMEGIVKGNLFPESNFSDQSHFIKEIKKFSGVVPKDLLKNENDRFIQFSALASK